MEKEEIITKIEARIDAIESKLDSLLTLFRPSLLPPTKTLISDLLFVYDKEVANKEITPIVFDEVTIECVNNNATARHEYLWNYVTYPAPLTPFRETFLVSSIEERERCKQVFEAKGYKVWRVG
jgi:hypothetical protein